MKAILFNLKAVFELPDNINMIDDNGDIEIELKEHPGKDLFINSQYLLDSADISLSQKDEKSLDNNLLESTWEYELVELSDEPVKDENVLSKADLQIIDLLSLNGKESE